MVDFAKQYVAIGGSTQHKDFKKTYVINFILTGWNGYVSGITISWWRAVNRLSIPHRKSHLPLRTFHRHTVFPQDQEISPSNGKESCLRARSRSVMFCRSGNLPKDSTIRSAIPRQARRLKGLLEYLRSLFAHDVVCHSWLLQMLRNKTVQDWRKQRETRRIWRVNQLFGDRPFTSSALTGGRNLFVLPTNIQF